MLCLVRSDDYWRSAEAERKACPFRTLDDRIAALVLNIIERREGVEAMSSLVAVIGPVALSRDLQIAGECARPPVMPTGGPATTSIQLYS